MLEMGIGNIGVLVDRMATDCPPNQFLREFTQNAIEAGAANIYWSFDDTYVPGIRKLTLTDNGSGMTADDLLTYINKLSSSSREHSIGGNFGIGAKISALRDNPEGLVYQSWRDGRGTEICMLRDAKGRYGLKEYQEGGQSRPYRTLAAEEKPEAISASGTKVIFLGKSRNDETFLPPAVSGPKTTWIRSYLNKRYFCLPQGTTIHVTDSAANGKWIENRHVRGQWDFLSENAIAEDTLKLRNFTAYWWLLKDDTKALSNYSGQFNNRGHVSAIHKDELYDVHDGYRARSALQEFGIFVGHERVVIYVEAEDQKRAVTNMVRDKLLFDEQEFPWLQIAEEFQRKMPQPLLDYLDSIVRRSEQPDYEEKINERLDRIKSLLVEPAFKAAAEGQPIAYGPNGNVRVLRAGQETEAEGKDGARQTSARRKSLTRPFLAEAGRPHEPVVTINYPRRIWVTVENRLRSRNDELEGHAGEYISGQNLLKINGDFPPLLKLIDTWKKEYKNIPHAHAEIRNIVQHWHEQVLVEAVIRLRQYAEQNPWRRDLTDQALSVMSLTAAAMRVYLMNQELKQTLAHRIRSLKPQPDAKPDVA